MRTRTKILLSLPVIAMVALVAASLWLARTGAGARWLLERAIATTDGALSLERVEGSLSGGLELGGLRWEGDGFRVSIPRIVSEAGFAPGDRTIVIHSLVIESPEFRLLPGVERGAPVPDLRELLAGLSSPVRIEFRRVAATDLRLLDTDGETQFVITRAGASGVWHQEIDDLDLVLEAKDGETRARGRVDLVAADDHDLDLTIRLDGRRLHEALPADLRLDARVIGDGHAIEFELASEQLGLVGQGNLTDWLIDPVVDAQWTLTEWRVDDGQAPAGLSKVTGKLDGGFANYETEIAGTLLVPALPPLTFALRGAGDVDGLRVSTLELNGDFVRIEGAGAVAWGPNPGIEARLAWEGLRWPPPDQPVLLSSASGRAQLSGLPDDWTVDATFDLDTPDYPGGAFEVAGTGGRDGGRFEIIRGDALGGRLTGSGELSWNNTPRVAGIFEAAGLDLGAVLPDWPARIDVRGRLEFVGGENERLALELEELDGTLRGEPLAGAGTIALVGGGLSADALELRAGTSTVRADGSLAGPGGLALDIDIRRPGWVASLVGGGLRGRLRLAPEAQWPLPELDLEGTDLRFGDLRVGRIVGVERGGSIELIAESLRWRERTLTPSLVVLTGDTERQRAELHVGYGDLEADAVIEGSLSNWRHRERVAWSGALQSFALRRADRDLLKLRDPAGVELSPDAYHLERACVEVSAEGLLCLEGALGATGALTLDAKLEAIPLDLSRLVLDHELDLSQALEGTLGWRREPGQLPSGFADLRLSPGELGVVGSDEESIETGEGYIGFRMERGKLSGGQFDIPFPGRGIVDLDFSIDDLALDGTGRIDGKADLLFNDLTILEPVTGFLTNVHGELESRLRISGTTADPTLSGRFALLGGAFDLQFLDAGVRDLEITGAVDDTDELVVRGQLTAGDGTAQLRALADFSDLGAIEFRTRLTGAGLLLADLPDLKVTADPDLTLERVGDAWRVGGQITIPRASISPVTNFVTRIGESPDLELSSGPARALDESRRGPSPVLGGRVEVLLGEDVRLRTDAADLRLTGGTELAWRGAAMPFAEGTVNVDGTVSLWGPRLTVTDGRVRWAGVPVFNPSLDIVAQRDVFGNTLIRNAGVRVGGTARRPDVEAFTRPLTTRERAWAVLITGSDVDFGQGVGALDVGTYIAPRLYLSYGISLFDDQNVVGLRYDLRRGWGIKATSGQRASGIDLSYTIEQDASEEKDD